VVKEQIKEGVWTKEVNIRDFIINNIRPYHGGADFLVGPSEKTEKVWEACKQAMQEERDNNGVRAVDTATISGVSAFDAGYIDRENEVVVGLQTDELLKRTMKPFGGFQVVQKALSEQGLEPESRLAELFSRYVKTHNDGVFSAYTPEIKKYRSLGILTGLPDNYARGRLIGDYRRVALYGISFLIQSKLEDLDKLQSPMTDDVIRLREEVADQINALKDMVVLGEKYDLDLKRPARNAQEAVQWTYMAYLAAVKEQDGAAMSLGNVSSFLDIYIENDIEKVKRLADWVYRNIEKIPEDVFSSLDVLMKQKAECQGHALLYTALARSAGVPTRVVNGIVYVPTYQGFLYHTWAESHAAGRWTPVDPTLGQVPADAAHVKLVEGESPSRLAPMAGLIGNLRARVVGLTLGKTF